MLYQQNHLFKLKLSLTCFYILFLFCLACICAFYRFSSQPCENKTHLLDNCHLEIHYVVGYHTTQLAFIQGHFHLTYRNINRHCQVSDTASHSVSEAGIALVLRSLQHQYNSQKNIEGSFAML